MIPEHPEELLLKTLSIAPADIVSITATEPGNLNQTWLCLLRLPEITCYLKLQGNDRSSSVEDEARVLKCISGEIDLVPKLIASGRDARTGRPFLITEALPGRPMSQSIQEFDAVSTEQLFSSILNWLSAFQQISPLMAILKKSISGLCGAYSPDFRPWHAASEFLACCTDSSDKTLYSHLYKLLQPHLHSGGCGPPREELVFGSLTTHNILTDNPRECPDQVLTGIIDFEAVRIGNIMYDAALFCLYLLSHEMFIVASIWIRLCKQKFGQERFQNEGLAFFAFLVLSRYLNGVLNGDPETLITWAIDNISL